MLPVPPPSIHPFSVFHGRQAKRICRINPNAVVVDEDISEYHRLYFFPCQFVCAIFIELFFFQGGKKAFHSCVVKAVTGTAQALPYSVSIQHTSKVLAGILAASVMCNIASFRFGHFVCSCSTVVMQSPFFMLSRISSATLSPLKQPMTGEIYSFPSAYGNSEMSVKNFSSGTSAPKLRFMRFFSF